VKQTRDIIVRAALGIFLVVFSSLSSWADALDGGTPQAAVDLFLQLQRSAAPAQASKLFLPSELRLWRDAAALPFDRLLAKNTKVRERAAALTNKRAPAELTDEEFFQLHCALTGGNMAFNERLTGTGYEIVGVMPDEEEFHVIVRIYPTGVSESRERVEAFTTILTPQGYRIRLTVPLRRMVGSFRLMQAGERAPKAQQPQF
jgi:hypothetical protein